MSDAGEAQGADEKCVSRRSLLKTAGCAGAAVLLAGSLAGKASAKDLKTYPQVKVANLSNVREGKPVKFDYPLAGRKNILVDCGCAVEGGAGPDKSIVAYSLFCTHLGCSVDMDQSSQMLVCECHQSVYDPKRSGRVVEGPAPSNLPMISLDVDSSGDIYATGVAGLIYGLRNNLLDGEEVR
ncbi:MAG: arsenate reductase (azurin) small subunit [Nitrospirota bacterium]|nr:arsenate reductase (azurin) small subunit [Nitrospirota bacterium]